MNSLFMYNVYSLSRTSCLIHLIATKTYISYHNHLVEPFHFDKILKIYSGNADINMGSSSLYLQRIFS